MKFKLVSLIALIILVSANCSRIYLPPTGPTIIGTDNTGSVSRDTIEFRVTGNASSAKVRYNNSLDGLVQFNTTLPYIVSFNSTRETIFLSLEATPVSYPVSITSPFLAVQIYVNGNLFREASSNEFLLNTISTSGNWRK